MTNLKNDIINGLFLTAGVFSFISGAFIISTVLFGASAIFSNINAYRSSQQA